MGDFLRPLVVAQAAQHSIAQASLWWQAHLGLSRSLSVHPVQCPSSVAASALRLRTGRSFWVCTGQCARAAQATTPSPREGLNSAVSPIGVHHSRLLKQAPSVGGHRQCGTSLLHLGLGRAHPGQRLRTAHGPQRALFRPLRRPRHGSNACNTEAQAAWGGPPAGQLRSKLFLCVACVTLHIARAIGGSSVLHHTVGQDIHLDRLLVGPNR